MNIIGHNAQQSFFTSCKNAGKLSHAYIFVGPSGVGKRAVANWLVRELVQTPLSEDMVHSDVHIVEQGVHEKTGKTKKHIDVDQIRALRTHMTKSSMSGGHRVGIIDDAHKMNVQAGNALLKTLEEPGKNSLLILITPDEMLLPSTVRSRAHVVSFAPVPVQDITQALIARGAPADQASELARQSLGRAGHAISWYTNAEQHIQADQYQLFTSLLGEPLHQKYALVETLFGKKIDHIADRARLTKVLASWQLALRDSMLTASGHATHAIHTSPGELSPVAILAAEQAITDAVQGLSQNIHPKLLIDRILFTLP